MMKFCFNVVRSIVIVVNLIVTALAALLVYISFTAFDQNYDHVDPLSDSHPRMVHTYVSILCATLGLVIALLSFLGLLGAVKRSKSILTTYSVIVLLMVALLLALAIVTYTMNPSNAANKEVDKGFVNSTIFVYNYVDSNDMKTKIIDDIQKSFSCCGVNSPNDWLEYSLHKIPKSCCSEPVESTLPVFKYCIDSDHKTGCWRVLVEQFHANISSVRTILYIFVAFGLICMSAAIFLIISLKKCLDVV